MLFSSITFLYYFLPILLIIYFLVKNKYKNLILFIFSLLFYFYGEPKYIIILLLSCFINYKLALLIEESNNKKLYLNIAIVYNVGQLLYFKYTDFFIENINNIFNLDINLLRVIMPIGISFFTFQTLSYVIDVYKKEVKASKSFLNFATYVSLFPQLVAGPIVRYTTIDEELKSRTTNYTLFSKGVKRFISGLAKKVLIANIIGQLCSLLTNMTTITVVSSWLNAIGFTLQIYFDFSGYSDMAIGLGLMFGFHFLENFNYPFIASSITDFWRRWHISLSSFFKDYIYIPLGGSKVSKLKMFRNILIVWMLTGFWHGAAWNFIFWGLYFAIILIIEKIFLLKKLEKTKIIKHIYTLIIVIISFVIFNSNSIVEITNTLQNMFLINDIPLINLETIYYLRSYAVIILIAILASTPLFKNIYEKIKENKIINVLEPIYYMTLFVIITAFLIDSSFNPFLYFRF